LHDSQTTIYIELLWGNLVQKNIGLATLYGVGLIACLGLFGFGSIRPFSLLSVGGDNLFTLTMVKSYMNGDGFRINSSLGFPGVQDNLFFPSFDFIYRAFLWVAAKFSSTVAGPYYLMYLIGCAGMFCATAWSLRSLGLRHWIAVIGSIVYVISPFFFLRSLAHDFLALYFSVPLGCALALMLWREAAPKFFVPSVIIPVIVIGTAGLYYAFFSALFICFVGAVVSVSRLTIRPVGIALAISVAIFVLIIVTGFGSGIIDIVSGRAPLVQRFAFEQLMYGLYLPDAMSLFKGIPFLGRGFARYVEFMPRLSNATGLFEWPGLLLSGVIFASAIIAAVAGASSAVATKWGGLIYISAACIVFGLLYSIAGGFGYFFNMFVAPSIRATARVMPFLSFFALVIVLSGVEVLLERKGPASRALAFAFTAALLACAVPNVGALAERYRLFNPEWKPEQIGAVTQMLAAKDASGLSSILQLPIAKWPEEGNIGHFEPYNHQLPFIFDKNGSTTKWSYGGSTSQPAFAEVAAAVDAGTKGGLGKSALAVGFDGVLIEKTAYEHAPVNSIKSNLESGGARKVFEDTSRALYALR
jgi:hypothetical protein